ncbi:streptomycin 6-kinase [Kitasatospora gansuensis]|uniref:Streptomycin 6-kinase n=1 Tax=Kitasatospora gansuensis TaxID=258050 RepID=A0A7W7SB59_9ACTN|nr:aminoglycoside phosphotransferase family protein [Kitasatospora gansuensis]MBB4946628.1 streptomycin 6-kinase [Kitasatospora gansuensis]
MSAAAGQQITVPARLTDTVRARADEAELAWLAALPDTVAAQLAHWDLTLERVVQPGGRLSLVCTVLRADGTKAVLKTGPDTAATAREAAALAHWAGRGAVLLLAEAPGALLLERLYGDIPLRSLAEAKAMLEAVGLLQRLWVPPADDHPFRTVAEQVAELSAGLRRRRELSPDAQPLVDQALEVSAALLADDTEHLLLHGDFDHGKVLAADRAPWLAVAPRPLVGERAWDLAWLAQDRLDTLAGSPGPRGAARRRLRQLADAVEVDHDRLRGWALFRAVEAGLRQLADGSTDNAELYLEFADWL